MKKAKVYAIGTCSACKSNSSFHLEDGAFDYEYGSIKGTHRYPAVWESDCCCARAEGEVQEVEPDYPDREGEY